ncbi:hypothetical protein DFQ28_003265 [Apophysomyces sp. BC1034]|nr:hypothetical protein DFQ28_003265 [Apophysomyces sp. BC1034]
MKRSFDVMAAEKEPDTARLTIEGRITPGPCMLTLSPAHLEMAPIRTEDLATDHPYYEGEKGEVKLNIFCPTNTSVGITSQDEKPDPNPFQQMSDDKSMPLATLKGIFSSDDAVVGVYALQLINMKYTRNGTEHKSEAIGRVHKGSGEWTSTPGGPLNGSEYNEISWGSNGGTIQAIGDSFSANILVTPFFRPAKDLDLTKEIVYRGASTITLTY